MSAYLTAWTALQSFAVMVCRCGDGFLLDAFEHHWQFAGMRCGFADITFDEELLLLLIGSFEVVRRNMWNFFRSGNEHHRFVLRILARYATYVHNVAACVVFLATLTLLVESLPAH